MSTGRSEFVRVNEGRLCRGRALWRELTGSYRSYRLAPMSWAIGERLDPQSVKGEPLNFHQVQTIDRESERFEEVGEPIEVFVVTIGTTATATHGGQRYRVAAGLNAAARPTLSNPACVWNWLSSTIQFETWQSNPFNACQCCRPCPHSASG